MATRPKRSAKTPPSPARPPRPPRRRRPAPRRPRSVKAASTRAAKPRGRARGEGVALVIVESPTKAKTIGKYLGAGYDVKATVGHLRDLPTRELGVDVERDFEPKYVTIKGKTKTLSELKKAAKTASRPSISPPTPTARARPSPGTWPTSSASSAPTHRVLFHEITKDAIHEAMDHPGEIDDRKVERAAGAPHPRPPGRLQGQPDPLAQHQDRALRRAGADRRAPAHRRARARDPRLHAPGVLEHRGAARQGRPDLRGRARQGRTATSRSSTRPRTRRRWSTRCDRCRSWSPRSRSGSAARTPAAPFTTSTLQQEAAKKLGFSLAADHARGAGSLRGHATSAKTARSASSPTCGPTRCACRTTAIASVRELHRQATTPSRTLPAAPNTYSSKKNARVQDAHEAVRPTDVRRRPEQVQPYLEPDQFRLYQLIWQRFVASQMTPAVYDMTIVDFDLGRYLFRATGSVLDLRRVPRALYGRAREGGREDDGRPSADSAARRRATRSRSGRSPRRSTSPSRRPGSPRPAW